MNKETKGEKEYLGLPGEVNPHIPQYIADAPWYLGEGSNAAAGPSLHHQKQAVRGDALSLKQWYNKGIKRDSKGAVVRSKRFLKGACENCGATTHKKTECLERPRRSGAKFTNSNIAPDEEIPVDIPLSWDASQDRYGGWCQEDYTLVLKDHELVEHEKRINQREDALVIDQEKEQGVITSNDEKYRCTTRNLRIREDTAKYLLNLDIESAFYDPKTRSMRENPLEGQDEKGVFRGDNAVLGTGEAKRAADLEAFAWTAYQVTGNTNFHAFSGPTQVSLAMQEHSEKLIGHADHKDQFISNKYDPEGTLNKSYRNNIDIVGSQTHFQKVYDESGTQIKPNEPASTAYVEDDYDLDHTTVWGSFYDIEIKKWGYSCCQKMERYTNCSNVIMVA